MDLLGIGIAVAVGYVFLSLRVIRQYERSVVFFLGRVWGTKGPGMVFLPAGFVQQKRISLRVMALDIPPQDVITRDNVSVKVTAVLYMKVAEPAKAVIEIEDYLYATSQLAQTTLRSVLGEVELDELLSDREKINAVLKRIIDTRTEAWGIEASAVEVKDVDLPDQMKRAMARQAEAERERRAKVIAAQGELQASQTLAEAARTLGAEPNAIQLRYLQTVTEIATENNSTTLFPIPIEMFRPFINAAASAAGTGHPSAAQTPMPAPLPQISAPGASAPGASDLPPEIQKVLGHAATEPGGMPSDQINDIIQQLRVDAAKRSGQGQDG
ncbi:MAG TPA: slipin family protein [Gemmatimonadales bacterium]|nr:slipin family protein [Gemmatimonadales bacterium]